MDRREGKGLHKRTPRTKQHNLEDLILLGPQIEEQRLETDSSNSIFPEVGEPLPKSLMK